MHAVILVFFYTLAVGVDIGVARYADHSAIERRITAKAAVKAGENNIFEQDIAVFTHSVRHLDHAVERGRDLDQAQQVFLFGALDGACQIQPSVAQVGEGVARIDDERRDDGGDVGLEVAFHTGALVAVEHVGVRAHDAIALQRCLDAMLSGNRAIDHRRESIKNALDLLGGGHIALVVHGLALEGGKV